MSERDDGFEGDETESSLDSLVNDWLAMREEQGLEPPLGRDDIRVFASPWTEYMDFWGDLDPTGSGFKIHRREGA